VDKESKRIEERVKPISRLFCAAAPGTTIMRITSRVSTATTTTPITGTTITVFGVPAHNITEPFCLRT